MNRLLAQHSAFADAYAEQIGKAVAKVSTHADTLKWVAKAEGDVYLNIGTCEEASCIDSRRNPAFWRSFDMFSGPQAHALAHEDGKLLGTGYLTTIILHPDGTWSERYLFRL